jgi:hypothetical protein
MLQNVPVTDFTRPFEIFIGQWRGGANVFSRNGDFWGFWPSEIDIRWKEPGRVFTYKQHIDTLGDLGRGTDLEQMDENTIKQKATEQQLLIVDFIVKGKRAEGFSYDGQYLAHAVESIPGVYLLMVKHMSSSVVYVNNHYFLNPTTRSVIGPTISSSPVATGCPPSHGLVHAVNAQTFTRISYDPGPELHPELVGKGPSTPASMAKPAEGVSKHDWNRLYAKAWLDDSFRKLLETDPTKALQQYAAEHGQNWQKLLEVEPKPQNVSEDAIQKVVGGKRENDDCPPPACC